VKPDAQAHRRMLPLLAGCAPPTQHGSVPGKGCTAAASAGAGSRPSHLTSRWGSLAWAQRFWPQILSYCSGADLRLVSSKCGLSEPTSGVRTRSRRTAGSPWHVGWWSLVRCGALLTPVRKSMHLRLYDCTLEYFELKISYQKNGTSFHNHNYLIIHCCYLSSQKSTLKVRDSFQGFSGSPRTESTELTLESYRSLLVLLGFLTRKLLPKILIV